MTHDDQKAAPQPLSGAAPAPTNQCSRCGKPNGEQWLHCQGCGHTLRDVVGEQLAYERAIAAAPVAVPAEPIFKYQYRLRTEDYIAGYREGVADSEAHARKIGEKK